MPSLLPGFEYDIFISYRQKDNKGDRWVTEFVNALRTELESTFKEDISIYFDENPHDGLLGTHDVDDSLKNKLKCLIFIPIISQTYCDPKCFAWEHEFIAFRQLAENDTLGLKVKLAKGNVASRILPIGIHELDSSDKQLMESELGGAIRGIDFIYRTAGVARPLKAQEEDAKANLNHTFYRDQINKVARAVKELTTGAQLSKGSPPAHGRKQTPDIPFMTRKQIAIAASLIGMLGLASFIYYYFGGFGSQLAGKFDRSIAVLPFENMNHDPEQDYFSNGITEDILNHLTKISDLKVKSRTSTLQYKGTQKSMTEIGEELSVGNIVEGSVRRVGNNVRIVVQLIDAKTDLHLWSETYDRELKDVLSLQSEIAIEIARALDARLTAVERKNIQKEVSQNVTAYDYFLKARELLSTSNGDKRDVENALRLVNQALQLDSTFSKAYGLKANLWYALGYLGASQKTWYDSAMYFTAKAIRLDPTSPDGYLMQGQIHRDFGKLNEARSDVNNAYRIAPNDPDVLRAYGFQLLRDRDEKGADMVLKSIENQYSVKDPEYYLSLNDAYSYIGDVNTQEKLLKKSKDLNPGSIAPYLSLSYIYQLAGQLDKGIRELKEAEKINPDLQFTIDQLAWAYYRNNDLENAARYWGKYKEIEGRFEDSTQTVPFRTRLAMVYSKMGKKKEADALVAEDLKIRWDLLSGKRSTGTWGNLGSIYYDLALDHAYLGKRAQAVQYLDSAFAYQFYYSEGYQNDPLLADLKDRDDFKMLAKEVIGFYNFRKSAFSNAFNRMEASRELKNSLK